MIDYYIDYSQVRDFICEYNNQHTERDKIILAKRFLRKIKIHYQRQKEFIENILPYKVRLMELANEISGRTPGKYADQTHVTEVYRMLESAIINHREVS